MSLKPKWLDGTSLYWALAGLVFGAVIHISAVLALPYLAKNSAYFRLRSILPANEMHLLPAASPDQQAVAYLTPDVRYAVCRFDLGQGSITLQAKLAQPTWSIAAYSKFGENFYTVTAADLKRSDVVMQVSRSGARTGGPLTASAPILSDNNLRVTAPTDDGLIVVRAPLLGTSYVAEIETALKAARCHVEKK
jgi:uncharacterized membrane protein